MEDHQTQHTCKVFVAHCMDFRFQKSVMELLARLGLNYGDFDRLTVAGGAGNFNALEDHIHLSKKLHTPSSAILLVHEDCGAGAKKEDLHHAKRIVFPHIEKVLCFYLRLNGEVEEV